MPFCHLTFSADRPVRCHRERAHVEAGTLGAQFRARRAELGIGQAEAAVRIGVSAATYRGWEVNRREPTVRSLPGAINFLGRDWRAIPATFGGRIRILRTRNGLSIRALAQALKIDPTTLRRWEDGSGPPSANLRTRVDAWLCVTSY